ncbi:MAG: saccharopine dehydrogenase family protein, partial [Candidatus Bathyarchaeia archaeon]
MNISIVGLGVQGSAILSVLTRVMDISGIVCADIRMARARRAVERLKDGRVKCVKVDANNLHDLLKVAKDSDVVINATLPNFNLKIMEAALKCGAHYVDLASDDPIGQLELGERWVQAGLTAAITQGGPFTLNGPIRSVAESLDRIYEIRLRHGWRRLGDGQIPVWAPSWCPEVSLSEWESNPTIYRNGEYERVQPFSGMEEYPFPEPLGRLAVCHVDYEPVYTLPKFIDKCLQYVDCKIPPDVAAGTLIKMGLASKKPIRVKGVRVVPRELLMTLIPQPADLDESSIASPDVQVCYLGEVEGEKDGEKQTHKVYRVTSAIENIKSYGV